MTRPLRILTIGHSYCVALNRAVVREVARDPNFQVTVASPSYFFGDLRPILMEPEPEGSPLAVVPLDTRFSRFVHVFRYDGAALAALIEKGDFDIVHAWEEPYIFAGYQIAQALKNSKARFCFRTAQSYVKHYPPPFGYFERSVLNRAQAWIAGASLVFQAMLKRGFPESTGRVLNLAVDLTAFRPLSADERSAVHTELALTGPVIGYLGRLTKAKGLDTLMEAMDQIGGTRPWSLLLLGSGEYRDKIEKWAERQGWSDRVKIRLAKHAEVPAYLGSMDMLVAPSRTMPNWREQFGRMIIEAFACGVPVLGSDSGEIPNVVGDGGQVVAEADVAAWVDAIQRLCDRPQEREALSKRALARAQKYSVTTIAQQYREFYTWLGNRPLESIARAQSPMMNPVKKGTA
ncbi:MAG TPA: glycosyltransferase family 4 protein [Bryobacteraceae bacterium]|nr:glycosyltransferase family 4 protein [Bryobacteraceae bacterium]